MRENARAIIIATWIGIIVNLLLTVVKAFGGVMTGSRALVADALHSASDVIGSIVVLFAVKIANKPPDDEHPYGHGKAEGVASIIVALLLIVVGVEISISSVELFFGEPPDAPGVLALFILIFSIIVKEILFYYKFFLGKKYNSSVLVTEAWHHRSDSLSSLAAVAGVGLAILGERYDIALFVYGDAVAGLIVSLIVVRVGYQLIKSSSNVMLEKVLDEDEVRVYVETVNAVDGVMRIDQLLARTHGSYIIIDIKLSVDSEITVREGHSIAAEVKRALILEHKEVEDVLVHVNPYE